MSGNIMDIHWSKVLENINFLILFYFDFGVKYDPFLSDSFYGGSYL